METSDAGPYAHARGTFAILFALGLFAAIQLVESLLHVGAMWALGTPRSFTSLVVAYAAVSVAGLAARAVVMIRAVRLPSPELLRRASSAWKPVAGTAALFVAWLAAAAVPAASTMLLSREEGVEWLARTSMIVGGGSVLEGLADQVILVVCLWLAFTRGRDVTLAPRA